MGAVDNFFEKKRNWSLIKDQLLDSYLTPYMAKLISTRKPLAIIDCFAGKGRFDEDSKPGSPIIFATHMQNYKDHSIFGYFIEKKYVADLQSNLEGYNNCKVFAGTFEENIDTISKLLTPNHNVFVYVDPYGIKSLDFSRFEKLKSRNYSTLELLLNFNSFGFLREGCRLLKYEDLFNDSEDDNMYEIDDTNSVKHMNKIANGDYWQTIISDFRNGKISMYQAEELFSQMYLKKLNNLFRFIIDIPIKTKERNIPKYRLIFGTNHPDGLILMADNMNKKWQRIIEMENYGQTSLFPEYYSPDITHKSDLSIENEVFRILSDKNKHILLKELIIELILRFGITYSESDYKANIKNMRNLGLIHIETFPRLTPTGKPVTSLDYGKYEIIVSAR